MEKLTQISSRIMTERFGRDNVISLATAVDNMPYARYVNAYYMENTFYIVTYLHSAKMQQIQRNPHVAIAAEWFTAHGIGENLGAFSADTNKALADTLRQVFSSWLDNGHSDLTDPNTVILAIRLESGTLFSHGTRYDIDFKTE